VQIANTQDETEDFEMMEDLSKAENKVSQADHNAAGEMASWLGVKIDTHKPAQQTQLFGY
jgi:hypothetical protein